MTKNKAKKISNVQPATPVQQYTIRDAETRILAERAANKNGMDYQVTRLRLAEQMMAGMLSNPAIGPYDDAVANAYAHSAMRCADALLAALDK